MHGIVATRMKIPPEQRREADETGPVRITKKRLCEVCDTPLNPYNQSRRCLRTHSPQDLERRMQQLQDKERQRVFDQRLPYHCGVPTPEELAEYICLEARTTRTELTNGRARGTYIGPRTIAAYLLRTDLRLDTIDTAVFLQFQNATSVSLAQNKIAERIESWDRKVIDLIVAIRAHYAPIKKR